jgi:anaphase-promoting complex subunit 6
MRVLFLQVSEALPPELSSVRALYATKLRIVNGGEVARPFRPRADDNLTHVAADAEGLFYQGRLQECHRLTKHVLDEDPHREGSLLWLYASVLVELGKKRELFAWAHAVAQRHTGKAEAWYAVGCYYLVTGKLESARTYLSKATTLALPAEAGPAWLAFGRAFSEQGEQDQAMAAYRTAHRCLPSSSIPLLCIGTELIRAHNFNLARQYLRQARGLSGGDDALVWNELGVVAYHNKEYAKAAKQLERAVALWQKGCGDVSSGWEEAMLANLGHAYRKLGRYAAAIACFEQALSLADSPETHAALAFTHHLHGHLDSAIQHYHTALACLPNHAFATHMLSAALSAAPLLGAGAAAAAAANKLVVRCC